MSVISSIGSISSITPNRSTDIPNKVTLVSDFGPRDLAGAEVARKFGLLFGRGLPISIASTLPYDTRSNGLYIAKKALAATEPQLLLHNLAPRGEHTSGTADNNGEDLYAAALSNGVVVVGPNSGDSWAFLAHENVKIYKVPFEVVGSQFRTRDNFAQGAKEAWDNRHDLSVYDEVHPQSLEPAGEPVIVWEYNAAGEKTSDQIQRFVISDNIGNSGEFDKSVPLSELTIPVGVNTGDIRAAGFCAAQILLGGQGGQFRYPDVRAVAVIDTEQSRKENAQIFAAHLDGDVMVVGPGDSLAWKYLATTGATIRDTGERVGNGKNIYTIAEQLTKEHDLSRLNPAQLDLLPEQTTSEVIIYDQFGNAKVELSADDAAKFNGLEIGGTLLIQANGRQIEAVKTGGLFHVPVNTVAINENGSSGWDLRSSNGDRSVRFRELVRRVNGPRDYSFAGAIQAPRGNHGFLGHPFSVETGLSTSLSNNEQTLPTPTLI